MAEPIILRRSGLSLLFPVAGSSATATFMGAIFGLLAVRGGAALIAALVFFLPAALFFAGYAWTAWRSRVTLHTDRIVKFNGFWSRTIMRDNIRGLRQSSDGSCLRIIAKDGTVMLLLIKVLKDEAAIAWFDDFDDLDALDFQASLDRISQDEHLGSTPEKRVERVLWLRRISFWLFIAVFAVMMWAVIWPRPFVWAWATLAAFPVIAVALDVISRGGVRYDYRFGPDDARPSVVWLLFLPGIALPGIVFHDWNIFDFQNLLMCASALGVLATIVLALRDRSLRRHIWPAVLCALLLSGYGGGLLSGIDVLFDHSPQSRFPVSVVGFRRSDHFDYVKVAPWGPRRIADEIRLPGHLVHPLRPGDRICVYLGQGRLGFRWYRADDC